MPESEDIFSESAVAAGQADVIEVQELSYSHDKHAFMENITVGIPKGKITSIVGPNGCGKSTLLKLIDGILVPHKGQVLIDGQATLSMSGRQRARRLALLVQGTPVPAMTVEALVLCGRYPHQGHLHQTTQADKRYVEEAMLRAGVENFRNHDLRHLSGGERQRAFIAMTLAQNADIIALDEPTTYLDVGACHEIMMLAHSLNRDEHTSIIMVIHDLDLALRYSDHIIVMERGSCLYAGDCQDVLASHAIEQAFQVQIKESCFDGHKAFSLFPLSEGSRKRVGR